MSHSYLCFIYCTQKEIMSQKAGLKISKVMRGTAKQQWRSHKATLEEMVMVPPQHKGERPHLCSQLEKTQAHVLCFLAEGPIHQGAERAAGLGRGGFTQVLMSWRQQKAKPRKSWCQKSKNKPETLAYWLHCSSVRGHLQKWIKTDGWERVSASSNCPPELCIILLTKPESKNRLCNAELC